MENVAQSYDELLIKEKQLIENISTLDAKMEDYRLATKLEKQERQNDEDDLDSFMNNLNEDKPLDKSDVRKMKVSYSNVLKIYLLKIINNIFRSSCKISEMTISN